MEEYNYLDFWELKDLDEEDREIAEESGCEEGILYHGPLEEPFTATVCPYCQEILMEGAPCNHCAFVYDYNCNEYFDFDDGLMKFLIRKLKDIGYMPYSYKRNPDDENDESSYEEALESEVISLTPLEEPIAELLKGVVSIEKEENVAGAWLGGVPGWVSGWFSDEVRKRLNSDK